MVRERTLKHTGGLMDLTSRYSAASKHTHTQTNTQTHLSDLYTATK